MKNAIFLLNFQKFTLFHKFSKQKMIEYFSFEFSWEIFSKNISSLKYPSFEDWNATDILSKDLLN